MRIVLKIKSIHDIYNANKKKEGWSTQKPTAPYEEPNQSTKSNNDEPSPMYNLTQSQRFMVFAFSFLCFFFFILSWVIPRRMEVVLLGWHGISVSKK